MGVCGLLKPPSPLRIPVIWLAGNMMEQGSRGRRTQQGVAAGQKLRAVTRAAVRIQHSETKAKSSHRLCHPPLPSEAAGEKPPSLQRLLVWSRLQAVVRHAAVHPGHSVHTVQTASN